MALRVGVAVGISALFFAGWNCVACSSSDSHPGALSTAGTASASAGTGGDNGLNVSEGGKGSEPTCAAQVTTAHPIPLDIYLMLDVSGSMLDLTASQASKWDAVKLALESFLTDDASAGLGVGLQYFPLPKPNAPASCTRDSDCGDSGPCFLKFCFQSSNFFPCQSNADCLTSEGDDAGPCTAIARCTKNPDYFCPNPGQACEALDTTEDLGTCQRTTTSSCLHTTSCEIAKYAAPASPIATLPGAAAGLVDSIDAQMPNGDTPTAPALEGAIQQASTWAKAHPDHRVVAVLATDGLPTECTPTAIKSVATLAKQGLELDPSISTFVIGVFGPDDVANGAPANLNQIAREGGTNQAFIVDTQKDVTVQFQAALDTIRGARLACQFQIPEPTSGTLNYKQVNVALSSGTRKDTVFFVNSAAECDPTTGGWHYDVDLSSGKTPTQIIACPTTCSAFQAAPSGASVSIELGCDTLLK